MKSEQEWDESERTINSSFDSSEKNGNLLNNFSEIKNNQLLNFLSNYEIKLR